MKPIRKILVPTDFSEPSSLAIERAVELAKANDAEILLLYVIQEADYPTRQMLKSHGFPNLRDEIRKRAKSRLRELQDKEIGQIRSEVKVREGVPSAEIADAAQEHDVDIVVIATHGESGLKRFFLGSTTERVVRIAPCSVLVVKDESK